MLPLCLEKITQDRARVLLVAPYWPRVWFPVLMQLLSGQPWSLPKRHNLLSQARGTVASQPVEPAALGLALERQHLSHPGLSNRVIDTLQNARAASSRSRYGMLADKLNMTPEEAERWIVNLIRNARLDAKIDSKLGHVVMGNNAVSPYQQVIEKTKSLSFRSQMLAMNIEKKINHNNRNETPNWAAQDSGF
ncbi:UNVERIFIED_CONTAM: hypothetical protein FKN15_059586 [Acipenser sinensis]